MRSVPSPLRKCNSAGGYLAFDQTDSLATIRARIVLLHFASGRGCFAPSCRHAT